jgi:DNA-binding HxlR family transcriptional regulator
MQQNHKRAIAGALAEYSGAIETSVILALTANARKTFGQLLHELAPISQSVLASALVALVSDGWTQRHPNSGAYALTSRALDMVQAAAARKQGGRATRRAA